MPPPPKPATGANAPDSPTPATAPAKGTTGTPGLPGIEAAGGSSKAHSFHGNVTVNASTAKLRLVQIAEEIIAALTADPNAEVRVSVEIQAIFPNGAKDQTKRAVSENARTLGFKNADWE